MRLPPRLPRLMVGLALVLALCVGGRFALSQVAGLFPTTGLSGAEVIEGELGVGGSSFFVTTGRLSSGYSYAYFTAFPSSFTIGSIAGTVNTAGMANGGALLINAANTAQTFTLPPTNLLIDGEIISVCNATASAWATNAVTVAANTNQSLVGSGTLTTLAASTCAKFIWNLGAATWFRVT